MENNNPFEDMPECKISDVIPCECFFSPGAGWYQNEFLPWIQNQDPKKLFSYGIGLFLLTGKLTRILTDFFEFPNFALCFQELPFFWA